MPVRGEALRPRARRPRLDGGRAGRRRDTAPADARSPGDCHEPGGHTRPHQRRARRTRPSCAHTSDSGPRVVLPAHPWRRACGRGGDRTARTRKGGRVDGGVAHPPPASHATARGGNTQPRTRCWEDGRQPCHLRWRDPGIPSRSPATPRPPRGAERRASGAAGSGSAADAGSRRLHALVGPGFAQVVRMA